MKKIFQEIRDNQAKRERDDPNFPPTDAGVAGIDTLLGAASIAVRLTKELEKVGMEAVEGYYAIGVGVHRGLTLWLEKMDKLEDPDFSATEPAPQPERQFQMSLEYSEEQQCFILRDAEYRGAIMKFSHREEVVAHLLSLKQSWEHSS